MLDLKKMEVFVVQSIHFRVDETKVHKVKQFCPESQKLVDVWTEMRLKIPKTQDICVVLPALKS